MANINKIRLSGQTYDIQDPNASKTVELTQAQYDALTVKDPNTFYVITDAQGADLSNYYTKSETSGATQISTALASKADAATTYTKTETDNAITAATATKQDTLVSGTNIKTINNESILGSGNINIQGGGSSYTAGNGIHINARNIISLVPNISASTGSNSIVANNGNSNYRNTATGDSAFVCGLSNKANGKCSFVEGGNDYSLDGNVANGIASHAEGVRNTANGFASHAEGYGNITTNSYEHTSGRYNNSVSASTTFGNSGNTLFSVGNGTADNARHNAFEIRQNGDIYLTKDGQDVKLQDQLGGGGSDINVVQTTGTSTTDVMSQDAVTTQLNGTVKLSNLSTYYINGFTSYANRVYPIFHRFNINNQSNGNACWFGKINNKYVITTGDTQISPSGLMNLQVVETSAITTSISSSSTDAQVPSAKAVNDKLGGLSLVKLTQAEYDALTTKDDNTVYFIGDSTNGYTMKIGSANVN